MIDYIDIAAAEERRKDVLRQAEVARQIRRVAPPCNYAKMLFEEATATAGHAIRFLKVLFSAVRAMFNPHHGIIGPR